MNKLLLILVLVVVLIVGLIIGAVGYFEFYEHTTKLNKYTGNGVSFEYPADYNLTEVKNNSTFLIATNTKNPDLTFQISKSHVNGTVYHGMSLDEYANSLVNDFKSRGWLTYSFNTTRSVDNSSEDVQVYSISYGIPPSQLDSNSVDNVNLEMFDKNGIRYIIDFQAKGKQPYDTDGEFQVNTSFKVL